MKEEFRMDQIIGKCLTIYQTFLDTLLLFKERRQRIKLEKTN